MAQASILSEQLSSATLDLQLGAANQGQSETSGEVCAAGPVASQAERKFFLARGAGVCRRRRTWDCYSILQLEEVMDTALFHQAIDVSRALPVPSS